MTESTKQKKPIGPSAGLRAPATTDTRFASVHSDPRFTLPKRKDRKIKLDQRFSRILEHEEFAQNVSVDRYGRKLPKDAAKEEVKRYYRLDDEDIEEYREAGEGEEESPLQGRPEYDPARGEGVSSTSEESSDESDEEEVKDEVEELPMVPEEEAPEGDVTNRLAVVNLDWDNVWAVDLMATLSSFKPLDGKVLSVKVYPSDFGRERMAMEEKHGPPKELFSNRKKRKKDEQEMEEENVEEWGNAEEEEINEKTIVKEDKGEEFDSKKLRNYQLERLRYYYAIVTCDRPETAKHIYDQCDGAEYEASANFFDLRFVPDGTTFEQEVRDECFGLTANYKPNEFVTDALQHSKVKLTWDQDDQIRKRTTRKAFSQREIEENDLKVYLASSDSDNDEEEARKRYRALLGLGEKIGGKDNTLEGDMEITFTSGLSEKDSKIDEPDHEETTIEKYKRKEKERKEKRVEKLKQLKESQEDEKEGKLKEDLGFDDPFFQEAHDRKKGAKQERKKIREEKKIQDEMNARERANLEKIMQDKEQDGPRLDHFDIKQIIKAEKRKKFKNKKKAKGGKYGEAEGLQGDVDLDIHDPRFERLYEENELAIDPTHSNFKQTNIMKKLMEERRKRSKRGDELEGEGNYSKKKQKPNGQDSNDVDRVQRLVQSLRKKSKAK